MPRGIEQEGVTQPFKAFSSCLTILTISNLKGINNDSYIAHSNLQDSWDHIPKSMQVNGAPLVYILMCHAFSRVSHFHILFQDFQYVYNT